MTPAEFRAALVTLGLSAAWIAVQSGRTGQTGRAWGLGRQAVPEPVAAWLTRRLAALDADPVPVLPPYVPRVVRRSA